MYLICDLNGDNLKMERHNIMDRKNEGLNYLKQYPKMSKWVNTCICCGSMGYDPDMPEVITSRDGNGEYRTVFSRNIRSYFPPLRLDDMGMCEI